VNPVLPPLMDISAILTNLGLNNRVQIALAVRLVDLVGTAAAAQIRPANPSA